MTAVSSENSCQDQPQPLPTRARGLAELVAFLATQPDVVAAYLFGSLAEGRASPRSDVDIAILLAGVPDLLAAGERQLALMGELEQYADRKMDVVMLNTAPPILQHQVLRNGRLLYERNVSDRIEFEVRAGKIYADLKPMYDFHTRDLLQKIKEVGLGGRRRRRRRAVEMAS
jgi:predicted nucleotidyltransferase